MGALTQKLKDAGVDIVGSCCGSTAEHTAAIGKIMNG